MCMFDVFNVQADEGGVFYHAVHSIGHFNYDYV